MQNFSTAVDATSTAINSAGSAARENSKHMESLEAKVSKVHSTFQELSNSIISSNLVSVVLDMANGFLELLNTPIGNFTTQVVLMTGAMGGLQALLTTHFFATIGGQFVTAFKLATGAIQSATVATTAFGVASKIAFPLITLVATAISAVIAIAPYAVDWFNKLTNNTEYLTEEVTELNTELEQNKARLEELNSIPIQDRTTAVKREIEALEDRNAELEEELRNREKLLATASLEEVRSKYETYETTTYQIGNTGLFVQGAKNLEEAVDKANQILKEHNIVLRDANGNYIDVKDSLVPVNEQFVSSEQNIQNLINEFYSLNQKLKETGSLTADEEVRYTELVDTLKEWSKEIDATGVDLDELTEAEKENLDTVEDISKEYDDNVASLYALKASSSGTAEAIDGLTYSLALATSGVALQKAQVDLLKAAYPQLSFQIDETTGMYYLEQEALLQLAASGDAWALSMVGNQKKVTQAVLDNLAIRSKEYLAEAKAAAAAGDFATYYKNLQSFNKIAEVMIDMRAALRDMNTEISQVTAPSISLPSAESVSNTTSAIKEQIDPIEQQNELYQDQLDLLNDRLDLLQASGAAETEQIELLRKMQQEVHEQAEWYRSQGLTDEHEYLRELGLLWWDYENQIKDINSQMFQDKLDEQKQYVEDRNFYDDWGADNEIAAWERVLEWMRTEYYEKGLIDHETYVQNRTEIEKNIYTAKKELEEELQRLEEERLQAEEEAIREAQEEWEKAHQERLDAINEEIEAYNKQKEAYEKLFDYVTNQIDKELEKLYKKQEAYEKLADYMVNQIDKQLEKLYEQQEAYELLADYMVGQIEDEISLLEEQRDKEEQYWNDKIDALEKENEELDRQIELETALDNLAKARQTKVMVYKDGKFQYIQDVDAVSEAQAEVDRLQKEEELRKETEALEDMRDQALEAIDSQIEALEKYKDEWASLVQDYKDKQDILLIEQQLGITLEGKNWKDRLDQFDKYSNQYENLLDGEIKTWENYKNEWSSLVNEYTEEQDRLLIEQELGIKLEGDLWKDRVAQFDQFSSEYKNLLDNEIAKWEEYKEQWSSVVENYEEEQDRLFIEQQLGIELEGNLWKDRLNNLEQYVQEYEDLMDRIIQAQEEADRIENEEMPDFSGGGGSTNIPDTGGKDEPLYNGMTYDEVLAKMRENGAKWTNAISQAEKDYWHQKNLELGALIGAHYDPASGKWDVFDYPTGYAKGTTSASGGLSLVGEEGAELRVLNSGDGIIPADVTKNLWSWGNITPAQMITGLNDFIKSSGQTVMITIKEFSPVLSNVTNGQDFADYLKTNFFRQVIQFQGQGK